MKHLFLDLAKHKLPARKIPYKHAQIGLMVTHQQAKKLTAPEEPHSVYVLPKKKAAHSIICAIHEILELHPDAKIALISTRPKVQAALIQLQNDYPQAQLLCHHKLGKTIKKFLAKKTKKPKPAPADSSAQSDDDIIKKAVANVQEALLQLNETAAPNSIEQLIKHLEQHRPHKKSELVHLISEYTQHNHKQTLNWIEQLQQTHYLHIDANENIHYSR